VLEIRPPVELNKGRGVRRLIEETPIAVATYVGDDTTDLDAFAALDGLDVAVRVAVTSEESPPLLAESADIVVGSTGEFLALLRRL
jgi:trehalose-6-phosphatase